MFVLTPSKEFKKKLILVYKHIRLKYTTETVSAKEDIKSRVNKLSEILDCTPLTAKKLVSKSNEILSISSDIFVRNSEFCSKYLRFSDIIEFPFILSLNSNLLQHRYFSLIELGCTNVTASKILKYSQLLKKTPDVLQKEGIMFCANSHFEEYISLLDLDDNDKYDIITNLQIMYKDGSNLYKIKETMNAEFFKSKLNCSILKVHELFKRYPPLKIQSIKKTNQMLDTLMDIFEFSHSKILQIPSLLSLHPEIIQNFVSCMPSILGINTIHMVNKLPQILKRPVESVQEIDHILRSFNISDMQLLCCPKIITFTPATLQLRLDALCKSQDFSLLRSYKKFLWLVYHYNNLTPRLQKLKQHDVPCSINMFTVSESNFNKYLSVNECRSHIKDICFYLANVFKCNEKHVLQRLKEYPLIHNSSLTNCCKVVEFLLSVGVTKQQILNGIGIIFYDFEIVKLYFQEIQTFPECQPFSEWINHYNLIQLLIYKIEVDAGFRGMHLYKATGKSDDFEPLSIAN